MTEAKTSSLSYNERRILGSLSVSEKTKLEIADVTQISESVVIKWLHSLKLKGLVYISGMKPNRATQPSPIYAVHAKHVLPPVDKKKSQTGKSAERHKAICDAIAEAGAMTSEEITDWIGCQRSHIDSAMTYYRKGGKCSDVFYIKSWTYVDRARAGWTPQYAIGPGKDAVKPAVDRREYMAKWRERNRAKLRTMHAARRLAANGKVSAAQNPFWQLLGIAGVQDHSTKKKDFEVA